MAQECVDPCLRARCGDRAECRAVEHQAQCICEPGLQGNPYVRCFDVECKHHDDCRQDQICNFASLTCEPLCVGQPCAENARCEASNHREICTCIPPYEGNGKLFCERRKFYEDCK